jgi:hypothetical protein
MHKGSRPITEGQAAKVFEALPGGYVYPPARVARFYGMGPNAIKREFEKRVASGEMKKIPLAALSNGNHADLPKSNVLPGKKPRVKGRGMLTSNPERPAPRR